MAAVSTQDMVCEKRLVQRLTGPAWEPGASVPGTVRPSAHVNAEGWRPALSMVLYILLVLIRSGVQ